MRQPMRIITAAITLVMLSSVCHSEVKPSTMFGNGMVLQREMAVPVWGQADAGEAVTVKFGEQSKTTTADKDGKWMTSLDALKASAKGETMTISGQNTVIFNDVLVGEVWVCSGQSNMAMGYSKIPELQKLVAEAKELPIRHFGVLTYVAFEPQENCKGAWSTGPASSAVAFGFSYYLQKQLNVPVAVIQTSWGSSSIEGWMPLDMTSELPHYAKIMKDFETKDRAKVADLLKKERWEKRDNVYLRTRPNILYNAMLHPVTPYAARGMVWYQGEANASNPDLYAKSLPAWVKRMRKEWGRDDFHFLAVMLPRFGEIKRGSGTPEHPNAYSWAWFREAQMGLLALPHTGVANTIDLGEMKNIHPADKEPIGKRLALLAARDANQMDIVAQGPTFKGATIKGATVTVSFEHAQGLKTIDGNSPAGFWLAGEDKNWIKASASIDGNTVIVTAEGLAVPVAVRYAFAAFPTVNLVNGAELPAYPFRSDDWNWR